MSETIASNRDKLAADLRGVISDTEEALRVTADQAGAATSELRARMQERLRHAKSRLVDVQEAAVERAKAAGHKADDFVHDHPWRAIGAAAGVGLIVGLLIGRR